MGIKGVNICKQWAHNKNVYLFLSFNYYRCNLQVYMVFKGQKLNDSMRYSVTSKTAKSLLKTKQKASKYWTTKKKGLVSNLWSTSCFQDLFLKEI